MLQHLIGDVAAFQLNWIEPAGLGFLDVDAFLARNPEGPRHIYDDAYFEAYAAHADTDIARALNAFRVGLVAEHTCGNPCGLVLDVGIGDGAFLRALAEDQSSLTLHGADINPAGIAYLIERGQLGSIDSPGFYDVVTFWDSLEHFRDPRVPLRAAADLAIVSLPTFPDAGAAIRSKHFKPEEHYWYFTPWGFNAFADQEGFDVVDQRETENYLGREGISTFVLKRRRAV